MNEKIAEALDLQDNGTKSQTLDIKFEYSKDKPSALLIEGLARVVAGDKNAPACFKNAEGEAYIAGDSSLGLLSGVLGGYAFAALGENGLAVEALCRMADLTTEAEYKASHGAVRALAATIHARVGRMENASYLLEGAVQSFEEAEEKELVDYYSAFLDDPSGLLK